MLCQAPFLKQSSHNSSSETKYYISVLTNLIKHVDLIYSVKILIAM